MDKLEEIKNKLEHEKETKILTMSQKIDKIYDAIYGNGKPGLVTIVSKQGMIIYGLLWSVGIIYAAFIGWIFSCFPKF